MNEKEFVSGWIDKLSSEGLKVFPDDFITITEFKEITLPNKGLILGNEFFGSFEILTADGNLALRAESLSEAKFIIYSFRLKPTLIKIPLSDSMIKDANSLYEKHLDSIIKQIEKDYKTTFPNSKNFSSTVNEVFRKLNLIRH